jgi:hypothetical protein
LEIKRRDIAVYLYSNRNKKRKDNNKTSLHKRKRKCNWSVLRITAMAEEVVVPSDI